VPEQVLADVSDAHSGPATGAIFYRRLDSAQWLELPTKVRPGASADTCKLVAEMPSIGPGTYVFRADAVDVAGNAASTTRRADNTEMAVRKVPPPVPPKAPRISKEKTRIFARLLQGRRLGTDVTVPFGADAAVTGRLVRADGAGIPNRELNVISRPSRGALEGARAETVTTGPNGGFRLALPPGPSRRVTVEYPGDAGLDGSSRPSLLLRVRGGVSLRAQPRALRTGQVVHLSGRVRAAHAPLPRRGKLVAVQYLESATHRWRPVLVTRTDHSGRFHARYRFRYVTGSALIRMRAIALPEERWPYAPGASRSVTVRVTGR
jgi:hypothetical protein